MHVKSLSQGLNVDLDSKPGPPDPEAKSLTLDSDVINTPLKILIETIRGQKKFNHQQKEQYEMKQKQTTAVQPSLEVLHCNLSATQFFMYS